MKKIFLGLAVLFLAGVSAPVGADTTTGTTFTSVAATPAPPIHPPRHHHKKAVTGYSSVVYGMAAYTPTPIPNPNAVPTATPPLP
jgi:hypothetical protein